MLAQAKEYGAPEKPLVQDWVTAMHIVAKKLLGQISKESKWETVVFQCKMLITFNIYFSKQIEMKEAEMLTSNFLVLFISNKNN